MPLTSGKWTVNINGNVTTLQINPVDSSGAVTAALQGALISDVSPFSGFWDEDAQKLTLFPPLSLPLFEVYTGYLFTDPINLAGVTGSVIFTLVGFVECFQPITAFLTANTAKRSVFGWYAQIGVD
ncbi:MAG TPA: hypothetical protein VE959_35585 [Bryobacteraceae bacterium]|nr:hypothetical protein [Bryobacteraceae bacterium]